MALNQLLVGQTASIGDGSIITARAGKDGEAIVSSLHGHYFTQALGKRLYTSYVSAVATSLAATATIGNMVWNPPGSGVRLSMLGWTSQIVATSATCTGIAIAGGYQTTTPTTTTAATFSGSTFIQQTTAVPGKGIAYSIATVLTAPLVLFVLHHNTAAINTVGMELISGDLEGSIVVDQGGFVTLCALGAAAAASGHTSSLMWEEVPI